MTALVSGRADLAEAAAWFAEADRVLVTAGAGLSAAAGYDYADTERFAELFPGLHSRGLTARAQLIGHPLPPALQWGFWAVHTLDIRHDPAPSPLYQRLRAAIGERPHAVITSNVDALFARNGFDTERIFTPQGDYALYQCLTPCTQEVWDAEPIVRGLMDHYDPTTGAVADRAVPLCPRCGGPTHLNVNAGRWYLDAHFAPQAEAVNRWLVDGADERLVVLEIGAGFNTPMVVRWPGERIVDALPHARFVRVNPDHAGVPQSIADRAASIALGAAEGLDALTAGG